MGRAKVSTLFSRSLRRSLSAVTKSAVRAGSKALAQALKPRKAQATSPKRTKRSPVHRASVLPLRLRTGLQSGLAGAQRYRLFVPPGVGRTELVPLLVMLHGCGQSAEGFANSTRMNQIAVRERFIVLYPEQNHIANLQGCWNWYQTRSGQAQAEATAILATISQVCRLQAVDPARIAVVGFSAGAGMAALLAARHPERFRAVAMHSGVGPGVAHSTAGALAAMRGHGLATPLAALAAGLHLPALLIIQGSVDPIVASSNGAVAAQAWADLEGAQASAPRTVQRGTRYPAALTDYRDRKRLVATLCSVERLGHAWSGGAASQAFSDSKGPDASRMVWAFAAKQFAASARHNPENSESGARLSLA